MEMSQETRLLLEKMEKNSRQQVKLARAQFFFSLVSLLCCAAVLLAVLQYFPRLQGVVDRVESLAEQAEDLVSQAEGVLTNLETVSDDLAGMDVTQLMTDMGSLVSNVDSLIADVNELVTSSQSGVEEALEKINGIDFETLNQAIKDLSDVIEPLAKFFNTFNRS